MDWLLSTTSLTIRPSSLPGWADCARREAARLFPEMIEAAGFSLRNIASGAGAAVGTAVHTAAHYTLEQKLETGELGNASEAEDRAITSFNDRVFQGILALLDMRRPPAAGYSRDHQRAVQSLGTPAPRVLAETVLCVPRQRYSQPLALHGTLTEGVRPETHQRPAVVQPPVIE